MSAHTVTAAKAVPLPGGRKMAHGTVTGSASYDTNGSVADFATACGLSAASTDFMVVVEPTATYYAVATGTSSAGKLKICALADEAEVGSGVDIHTTIFKFFAIGAAI